MSSMVEVKVSDLIGPALDWAVAKAERVTLSEASWRYQLEVHGCIVTPQKRELRYSTDWSQGGPLIEKYMIRTQYAADTEKRADAGCLAQTWRPYALAHGDTLLIAACRAIVAAKLGDTVQIPQELMP